VAGVQDFGQVTFRREGPFGIATLNRPGVLNAQGFEMLAQVNRGFGLARAGPQIRVVIVRGSGGVFTTWTC
jgi:enoyl-CoA hydratase/carnithine racemase